MPTDIYTDRIVVSGVVLADAILPTASRMRCRGFRFVSTGAGIFQVVETSTARVIIAGAAAAANFIDEFFGTFYLPRLSGFVLTTGQLVIYLGKGEDDDGQ